MPWLGEPFPGGKKGRWSCSPGDLAKAPTFPVEHSRAGQVISLGAAPPQQPVRQNAAAKAGSEDPAPALKFSAGLWGFPLRDKALLSQGGVFPYFLLCPFEPFKSLLCKNAPRILPPSWLSWKIFPSSCCTTASNPAPISCRGFPVSNPTSSPGQAAASPRGWQTLSHPHALPPLTLALLARESNSSLPLAQAAKQRCAAISTAL